MAKTLQSLVVLAGLFCLALGYEAGFQYVYNYHGRSAVGISDLKEQYGIVELRGKVIVQTTDEKTLYVKLNEWHVKRNNSYQDTPYMQRDEFSTPEEIEGVEENLIKQELLSTPFVINHLKGSIVSVKIGSDEPAWIVNIKKSIASQLQMDITGVRADEVSAHHEAPSGDFNRGLTTFEDGVTGDCSTIIQVNRLPAHQVFATLAYGFGSFENVCKSSPVWEVTKTKDFNRCLNNPVFHAVSPASYMCTLGRGQCGNAMQRTATYRYIGCGPSAEKMTVVHISGFGDFMSKPFGIKTEEIHALAVTDFELEKKETLSAMFSAPSSPKELKSLSYAFADIQDIDGNTKKPELKSPWYKSPVPSSSLMKSVFEAYQYVAKDLIEKPDSESDNIERLVTISRVLPYLSFDELRSLWEQVKSKEEIYLDLFVDTLVQAGSNPAIMLVKDLIESEQIKGSRAAWALGAISKYVKTPTRELLHELIGLIKSRPVQSSKLLKQTAYLNIADLLSTACDSPFYKDKKYPVDYLGDICDSKDALIINEFLPMLAEELKSTEGRSTGEHMAALTAVGSLGVEEILPLLQPHIQGSPSSQNGAERIRAIYSLHRVLHSYPEKVLPWLMPLAENVAERPEVRIAAISMIATTNAPLSMWQRIASRTWFEPSAQIQSYVYDLFWSISKFTPISPMHQEIINKARMAFELAQPAPFGLPYSMSYMRVSFLREGLGAIMHSPMWRIADEKLPVAVATRFFYQFGPFGGNALEVFAWNYNMDDWWSVLFSRFTGKVDKQNTKTVLNELKQIWDEIKPERRPQDKSTGFIQLKLVNSIQRVFDLLDLEKDIPALISQFMSSKPLPISFLKYRMFGEVNMRIPTEIGLPMRFLATLPALTSWQGEITPDMNSGAVRFHVASEISWKLNTEVRVELPWSSNYIASGVDVRNDVRFPRESTMKFSPMYNQFNWTWTPTEKTFDMLYYHVQPYTISRNLAESYIPTLESEKIDFINVTETPFTRDLPLAERWGVDLRLQTYTELEHTDMASWAAWFKKFDANSFFNLGFVPLNLRSREYTIRYQPQGTKVKSLEAFVHWNYYWKNSQRSTVFETGTNKPTESSTTGIQTKSPHSQWMSAHIADRLFKEIDGGNARVFMAGFVNELQDGSRQMFNASLGISYDDLRTKSYRDVRVERSTIQSSNSRQMHYVLCGATTRNWNQPAAFGFTQEPLYLTEDSRYTFGSSDCNEAKVNFKAKVSRNETAAKWARESPAGRQCQEHVRIGMLDSPACYEARQIDHTYNVYELTADYDNLPIWSTGYFQRAKYFLHSIISPFVVDHRLEASNPTNRISWTIKRNPFNGDSDMTVVRPGETIEARNVRGAYVHFSPLLTNYWKVFYPLSASRTWKQMADRLTYANVTESQCYVGPKMVFTFDGPTYNYTFDGCNHVLVTDSWKNHSFAVLSRESEGRKIVTVIYEKDIVELDPSGSVTINGAKKPLSGSGRIQIQDGKRLIAEIYSFANGIKFYLHPISFYLKVQGNFVNLWAPLSLRGKTTGVCGDYNQESTAEWRTASRCAVSSGEVMAASFRLNKGEGCSALPAKLSEELKRDTQTCYSIDEKIRTFLPPVDLKKPTKCVRYEPLTFKMGENLKTTCTSTVPAVRCNPGCKPTYMTTKAFTMKCSGGDFQDFHTEFTVPVACNTY